MRQPDLFGAAKTPAATPLSDIPDPAAIRVRLHSLLETARAATTMPWPPTRARVQEIIFHNMANWLPPAERDELRAAFLNELNRLSRAAA